MSVPDRERPPNRPAAVFTLSRLRCGAHALDVLANTRCSRCASDRGHWPRMYPFDLIRSVRLPRARRLRWPRRARPTSSRAHGRAPELGFSTRAPNPMQRWRRRQQRDSVGAATSVRDRDEHRTRFRGVATALTSASADRELCVAELAERQPGRVSPTEIDVQTQIRSGSAPIRSDQRRRSGPILQTRDL